MATLEELRDRLRRGIPSYPFPAKVDVNGRIDEKTGIEYIGNAYRQPNGKYRCLANVNGALAHVEISLRPITSADEEQNP